MSGSDLTPLWAAAPLLGLAFGAGALTQLARQLAQQDALRWRPLLALTLAAGIAALTVVALLSATRSPPLAPAVLLAAACITGWSGPGILARLGILIEQRLGLGQAALPRGGETSLEEQAAVTTRPTLPEQSRPLRQVRSSRRG